MSTLGENWKGALNDKETAFDFEANRKAIMAIDRDREREASAFLAHLKSDDLPNGIASCASRGSNSLCLEAPNYLVGTTALAEFSEWLNSQGIEMRFLDTQPSAVNDDNAGTALQFHFTPSP